MAMIGRALADHNVSIESMIQQPAPEPDAEAAKDEAKEEAKIEGATISIVTHRAKEAQLQAALAEIGKNEMTVSKAFVLRVEE
jgi:homoserine dehydrogenase